MSDFDLPQFHRWNNPNNGIIQFINPDNGIVSIVPTFDYYFIEKNYRTYLGAGAGYYFLANYNIVSKNAIADPTEEVLKISVKNQIGFLLRGGLEFRKLMVGLEVNYILKADIEIPNKQIIGTANNSYIGLSIGYVLGVGRGSK